MFRHETCNPRPVVLHARVMGNQGGGPDKTILRSGSYVHASLQMAAGYIHAEDGADLHHIREQADRWNCPLYLVPERHGFDPRTPSRMLALCRALRVDIWHGHDYKTNLLGLMLRRFHPMKLVTTAHGWVTLSPRLRAYQALDRRLLRWYDHVIAVSPDLADACAAHGVADHRLTYVPNAIEPREYLRSRSTEQAKSQLGIDPETLVIGCVSRLHDEKRLDRAINLLPRLGALPRRVELHLVGDGPRREQLQQHAVAAGVADRVRFHGWQPRAQRYYEAMDLLLMPSDREGLPNTLLEAMALDVPVAATDVGGIGDLLDGGRCGVLLPTDTTDWPERLLSVLSCPQSRETLVARGRQRMAQRFTFAARMQRLVRIYRSVLDTPMRRAA
jgi:glycosyltransferase involved in cell wall biosynthesis